MNEMRHVKYLLATLLVASLAMFGCGDSKKKAGSSGSASGGAAAKAAFGLFGQSTNMVVGVNLAQITSSGLYKKFKPMLDQQMMSQGGGELRELKEKCGIDPMTDFKSIIVGGEMGANMQPKEETMMAVVKGPARDKVEKCGEKMGEGAKIEKDGDFTKVTDKDGDINWYGWLDNNTFVASPKMDKAALETRMSGKDGLDKNADMMALIGNTDQGGSIWFAVAPTGGIKTPPNPMGIPVMDLVAAFGSIKLTGGVALDLGARTASGDVAKQLKGTLEAKIKEMRPMADMVGAGKFVDKLKLSTNAADLLAKVALSGGDIDELQKMAGM